MCGVPQLLVYITLQYIFYKYSTLWRVRWCYFAIVAFITRRALNRAHVPPTKLFRRLAVNKTIVKPRVVVAQWDFPDVIKFRVAAHTISRKNLVPASGL